MGPLHCALSGSSRRQSASMLFQLLEATYAPWLVAHSYTVKSAAWHLLSSIEFCSQPQTFYNSDLSSSLLEGPMRLHWTHPSNPRRSPQFKYSFITTAKSLPHAKYQTHNFQRLCMTWSSVRKGPLCRLLWYINYKSLH